MKLVEINRFEMMRKRHEYFSAVAEEYTSFADFIKAHYMWLAIMGIELTDCGTYVKLYIQLDFSEYEEYFIVQNDDGTLTVWDIVRRYDETCSTHYVNILTGNYASKNEIIETESL